MADNVQDAPIEILKRIQESIADLRREIEVTRQDMAKQSERFAAEAHRDRRNINGLMALLQAASGDFDERIREIDDRVSHLEDRAG